MVFFLNFLQNDMTSNSNEEVKQSPNQQKPQQNGNHLKRSGSIQGSNSLKKGLRNNGMGMGLKRYRSLESLPGLFFYNFQISLDEVFQKYCFYFILRIGTPRKKMKPNNGITNGQQPKNTVAMLNELRQGLIYNLEGQTGPVHAPIFTMTVEVKLHSN